jgi:hypothetical protein
MRKAFTLLEAIFATVAVVGLGMRLSFVTGGDFLLVISLGLLATLYFVGGYFQGPAKAAPPAGAPDVGTALRIWSGILFSTGITGVLGTLLFWPGFRFHLSLGLVGSLGMLLGSFLASRKLAASPLLNPVFRRSAVVAAVCALVWLIPAPTLFRVFHRNDPALLQKWDLARQHPDNPAYQADFDAYRRRQHSPSK